MSVMLILFFKAPIKIFDLPRKCVAVSMSFYVSDLFIIFILASISLRSATRSRNLVAFCFLVSRVLICKFNVVERLLDSFKKFYVSRNCDLIRESCVDKSPKSKVS